LQRYRLPFIFMMLALIIALAGCGSGSGAKTDNAQTAAPEPSQGTAQGTAQIRQISTGELERLLAQAASGDMVFIDVREPDEYAEGHIEGMVNMPLSTLEDTYSQLPKDKEIVIICRSGNRSMQAAQLLRDKGYTRLVNVQGGMLDWKGPVVRSQ